MSILTVIASSLSGIGIIFTAIMAWKGKKTETNVSYHTNILKDRENEINRISKELKETRQAFDELREKFIQVNTQLGKFEIELHRCQEMKGGERDG